MAAKRSVACLVLLLAVSPAWAADGKKVRLFILSGQSNMAGLDPNRTFTPELKKAFPDDDVIVVKSAQGGQPIRRWFKQWKPGEGQPAPTAFKAGDLYDVLMTAVTKSVGDKKPDTICFVWMQGERDAREKYDTVYAASLQGLIAQLRSDLKREDISFVIGRLSDNQKTPSWDGVRKAQVSVAEQDPRGAWVDTDDLNGPKDALHYTKPGYDELGLRFAKKAIELVNKK